jgi:hypothetical protein
MLVGVRTVMRCLLLTSCRMISLALATTSVPEA